MKRRTDEVGNSLPSEEEVLRQLVGLKKPAQCHIDGYYPMGVASCVMVMKDESDRILIIHEVESENRDDAKLFLRKLKDSGITVTSAFSDYSESYVGAIRDVFPDETYAKS